MPSSTVISGASSSASSTQRRKNFPQYRTLSQTSYVDETLFGPPRRVHSAPDEHPSPVNNVSRSNSSNVVNGRRRPTKKNSDAEIIEVITKDMIRKLRVPSMDPSGRSLILSNNEYDRIKRSARVLTKEEREAEIEEYKARKKFLLDQCEERKNFMQTMELQRQKNEKLSDFEQEAKEKSQYLLQKAQEQMEEQEDEIKKLNEVILNAKCHAIRDAQLVEKVDIKKEVLEEEKRLDEMMENDRLRALREYEEREQAKRIERLKGAEILQKQVEQREQQRLLDEEKKDQETKAMLQYLEKLRLEDMDALIKKKTTQRQIMQDVAKANEEIQTQKDLKKEQEKLAEIKVMAYLKEKEAREEAFEREKEIARIEKEKEIARLRAQQERAKDKQAEKDALRAKRNQEEAEREWRKKEREDAFKKAQVEDMLKKARQEQIAGKEHYLAVQAARDRAEFERVLLAQEELATKEEVTLLNEHKRRSKYADDVRKQIREKEKERVHARDAFFEEGIKLDMEARERRQKLDEIKQRKLRELKDAGVPDRYVNEVSRRVQVPQPSLSSM